MLLTAKNLPPQPNRGNSPRLAIPLLAGDVIDQGSRILFRITLSDAQENVIEVIDVDEVCPVACNVGGFLNWLHHRTERTYQNWELGYVQQNPRDYRLDFHPRILAYNSEVSSFDFTPIYTDTYDPEDIWFATEQEINGTRWVFDPSLPPPPDIIPVLSNPVTVSVGTTTAIVQVTTDVF